MNHMSHHGWDVSLDPHTVPVFLWLQWAHRRSLQPMQPTLARHALSSAEFDLLATLRNAEPDYTLTPGQSHEFKQDEVRRAAHGIRQKSPQSTDAL